MIRSRLQAHAEIGTEKRGAEFGDEFFHRVRFRTKAVREVAIESVFCTGPMCQFMQQRRVVRFGRTACGSREELFAWRKMDRIGVQSIERSVAAVLDGRVRRLHETVHGFEFVAVVYRDGICR